MGYVIAWHEGKTSKHPLRQVCIGIPFFSLLDTNVASCSILESICCMTMHPGLHLLYSMPDFFLMVLISTDKLSEIVAINHLL